MAGGAVAVRAFDAATAARWLAAVDAHPAWAARSGDGFVATASSLRLDRIGGAAAVARLAAGLLHGDVGMLCRDLAGPRLALAVDACWVRRQYPDGLAPAGHAPHAWHQDGGLGFDFAAGDAAAPGALLTMATCWIALEPCGTDAPGLEAEPASRDRLLTTTELAARPTPAAGRAGAAADVAARLLPPLAPGQAWLFDGGLVHRTGRHAAMTRPRTSIELRFLPDTGAAAHSRAGRLQPMHLAETDRHACS